MTNLQIKKQYQLQNQSQKIMQEKIMGFLN
jgi:hypothetical protein